MTIYFKQGGTKPIDSFTAECILENLLNGQNQWFVRQNEAGKLDLLVNLQNVNYIE